MANADALRALVDRIEELESELGRTQKPLLAVDCDHLAGELESVRERNDKLTDRVQQLENERRVKKLHAQKRIEEALGKYEGDWLQEACARLKAKREVPLSEVARVIGNANGPFNAAHDVCEFLGITLERP